MAADPRHSPRTVTDPSSPARPAVSVLLPFYGDAGEAAATRDALLEIELRPGDELVVADNTPDLTFAKAAAGAPITVVHATLESSSYHARNVAAQSAAAEWLLFIDGDCRPPGTLLDDYFDPPPGEKVGAVAGEVVGVADQPSLVSRYSRARGHLGQQPHVSFPYRPFGVTANLLVRRSAWASVGGFQEGIRSGADAEFCWRLQDAGWSIGYAPQAVVEHLHRETVRELARQAARYGAGRAWVNRRYHGSHPRLKMTRRLGRCAAGVLIWTLAGQTDRARFKALDAVFVVSESLAYYTSNRAVRRATPVAPADPLGPSLVVWADAFPALSETFITGEIDAALRLGARIRVEAGARPPRPERSAARRLAITYLEDDSILEKLRDEAWLLTRHPLRCLADLLARRRWRREEVVWPLRALAPAARRLQRGGELHLHAHFAATAALNAMRVARLTGRTYSVATHGYDIFQHPRNLREKHVGATFAVTSCEYSARHLRELVGPAHRDRIHTLIMGVDPERLRRTGDPPGTRRVGAVARLVEKKGLEYLIRAAALIELDELVIAGDGPLRGPLERVVGELGLEAVVRLPGALERDAVHRLLERIDVLAMPCVVAADGDRDTMPVIVKEAMALEIPVVGSDEVGLPELIRPAWGRLVPPRQPAALAAAIGELLSLPLQDRRAMGAEGRRFVIEHANVHRETARLLDLVARAGRR